MASKEKYEQIVTGKERKVGVHGEVRIPKELRDELGIQAGDRVGVAKTDDGTVEIVPPPK